MDVSALADDMNLREELRRTVQGNVVVIGVGNPCRGDDAAGSCAAQRIRCAPGVHVIDAQDVPENYLCQIADKHPDTVVLIDCADMKSTPGSVALFENDQTVAYWPSTHRVPVGLIVDYLNRTTHARILLIAIQPQQTNFLQPISAHVLSSVGGVARALNEVLKSKRMPDSAERSSPLRREVLA